MYMRMESLIKLGLIATAVFIFYSFEIHAATDFGEIKAYNKAGAIVGTLKADSKCEKVRNEIWVSQGRNLYYQAEVPINGSFEFHVVPGKYNIVATGANGCFVEAETFVKMGSVQRLSLLMKPAAKTSQNTQGAGHE